MKKIVYILLLTIIGSMSMQAQDYQITDTIYVGESDGIHEIALVRVTTDTVVHRVSQDFLDEEILDLNYEIWLGNRELTIVNDRLATETNEIFIRKLNEGKHKIEREKRILIERRKELLAIQGIIDSN